jgi:hypothetical protein
MLPDARPARPNLRYICCYLQIFGPVIAPVSFLTRLGWMAGARSGGQRRAEACPAPSCQLALEPDLPGVWLPVPDEPPAPD